MPLTVTLGYTDPQPTSGRIAVGYHNSASTGGWNRLWRSTPSEYSGLPIKIADPLPLFHNAFGDFANFQDYNVESNKTYAYYIEVTPDGSAIDGTSDTDVGSVTLTSAWIHGTRKNGEIGGDPSNADIVLQLHDLAPLQNVRTVNTVTRLPASSSKPRVSMGTIERNVTTVPIWMPLTDASRSTLRAIYESIYYVCLRTTVPSLGKLFGTITAPREVYSGVTAGIACEFTSNGFKESVA